MKDKLGKHLRIGSLILLVLILALTLSSSALSNSPPQEPPPPSEVRLDAADEGQRVELSEGQVLVVSLESNPSTGYMWEMAEVGAEGQGMLRQRGETEFQPESGLLGAPGMEIMRFEAVREGQTTLELVYHRPWEAAESATTFSLQVQGVGSFSRADDSTTNASARPSVESPVVADDQPQLGLPTAYNWCDLGGCTPIRNQGACGSCWAFGTVGPLESNILIHDGLVRNLSEQYLVSCNTDGWGCDGGLWAHDYHWWKMPPGEPDAGAAYEADFPYAGWDAPCNSPHTHYEKIESWHFVGDSGSVPSVAAIKQAILDHGPVSAGVCVDSAFRSYSGGVFLGPGCTTVGHAIVLVGWDDNQGPNGVWYLRNSWGPGWGESGYMRIGYGVSNVGYGANYVVYPPCYTVSTSVNVPGTGTITAAPPPDCGVDTYGPGTEVELTANASPGWHFWVWGGDASGSSNPTTITMDSDKSVTAHFMCDGCVPRVFLGLGLKDY